jgi:hypothetical protein
MKHDFNRETYVRQREEALMLLEQVKTEEQKRQWSPLYLNDKFGTVFLVPPQGNKGEREKLLRKKQKQMREAAIRFGREDAEGIVNPAFFN